MTILTTVLLFVVVLSLLVLAHELGHFVTAKLAGIKVQEFGLGFPPRILGLRRGETLYSLNALPLGGFVKMLGENGEVVESRAFASQRCSVRAIVLIAGSAMNLLRVPLFLTSAFMIGAPEPCLACQTVQVHGVIPGGAAEAAGLRPGDLIETIDGELMRNPDDVRRHVRASIGRPLDVRITRVGERLELSLTPREVTDEHHGALGVQLGPEVVIVRHSLGDAVPRAILGVGQLLETFPEAISSLLRGDGGAELTGPIGIAWGTGRAAQAGWSHLFAFISFLSLNLAVFNMLPFPGLDGGRLVFVLIEALRHGRRIRPRIEGAIHLIGMVLFLALMAYASVNDVRRLLTG